MSCIVEGCDSPILDLAYCRKHLKQVVIVLEMLDEAGGKGMPAENIEAELTRQEVNHPDD